MNMFKGIALSASLAFCALSIGCGVADDTTDVEARQQALPNVGLYDGMCAYYGEVTCCALPTCNSDDPIIHVSNQAYFTEPGYGGRCPRELDVDVQQNGWHCQGTVPYTNEPPAEETPDELY